MQRWKATLAYDGTPYHGWQIQPKRHTVQGILASALQHITGESTLPQGSGRTDTGVHALAQVAHFDLTCPIPQQNLHRALNRSLPPSIRVLTLDHCPPNFHARHSALSKTYEYRILPRPHDHETICPPFLAPYLWPYPYPLSLDLLNQAASQILGTQDFTSFAAVNPDLTTRKSSTPTLGLSSKCDVENCLSFRSEAEESAVVGSPSEPLLTPNTRTIQTSTWTHDQTHDPPILRYRVTGSGFLHHMVRNLVGTFTECGAGRLDPIEIPTILANQSRRAAGPTAPPHGLFLAEVTY